MFHKRHRKPLTRILFGGKMSFKRLFLFLTVIIILTCSNVFAQKVRLRSQITPNCNSGTSRYKFSDIFADGNIAVQGSYNCTGAFIYDISNPDAPTLSSWYNPGNNQQFLEAIVIGNRGYFGSGNGGGVHIVDLTNPANPVLLGIVNSTAGNGHNSVHEIMIWNNILIENFNSTSNKVIKFINVSNPANPVFIRDFNPTEIQWVHAFHIRGSRLFTSGWGNSSTRGRTEIYDIANVAAQAPTLLGFIEDSTSVTGGNNMHSSWSSEDGNYLYSCRETSNGNGDVRVYNITNPANPLLVKSVGMVALNINAVTPHNPVVMGNYLYVAWYQAGLQVFDISNPANPVRVGQYDTYQPTFTEPTLAEQKKLADDPWDMICGLNTQNNLSNALPTVYDGNWAVYPFLGQNKVLTGDLTYGLQVLDVTNIAAPNKNNVSDFDGDGKTDYSGFTPNTGSWQIERSSNSANSTTAFGIGTDKLVAADYDGDGKSDVAIWRPSTGVWWIQRSSNGSVSAFQFGLTEDIPVPADYDADGKTDIAVWRPSTGVWYINQSTLGFRAVQWGVSTDKVLTGDFEGDGKADQAVWRPSNGVFYVLQSSSSIPLFIQWGLNGDKPVTGDFDGDGKTDYAVVRPAANYTWYILNSSTNSLSTPVFGLPTDMITAADYDGDGKTDVSVFRPSTNQWYRLNSSNNAVVQKAFGQTGDMPSPNSVQPQ
jgi:hypothetical protein